MSNEFTGVVPNQNAKSPLLGKPKTFPRNKDRLINRIKNKVNPLNHESRRKERLMRAISIHEEVEAIRLIRETGMKPGDFNNYPFMYYAAAKNQLGVVEALIAAGANIEPDHPEWYLDRPLSAAARMGHAEVVRALLEAGADANRATKGHMSPLDAAENYGHTEVVKILEAAGARRGTPVSGGRKRTRKYKNKNRKTRRKA
jgi:hypothetical protein